MKYKTKEEFLNSVIDNYSDQKEFHQAVEEVIHSIWDTVSSNKEYGQFNILDRIVTPDRVIMFRVPWMDDNNNVHVNLSLAQFSTSKFGQVLLVLPVSRCPTILALGYKNFHFLRIFSNDAYCFFVN